PYFWRVSAQNSAGQGPWSQTRTFITLADTSGPTSELVAHWKMDEGSGNTLIDHSGYGNNGVLRNATNVTWVPGVDGLALNLPGSVDRYAEVNNAPSLNISDKISITGWIRPTAVQSKVILGKSTQNGYEVSITNTGKIEFWLNWTANNLTYHILSTNNYIANGTTWTHFAAIFDGLSMKIYLNGVEDNSKTFSSPATILNNNSILRIGAWGSDYRWTGGLDDLRIYHGALNAQEVSALFSSEPAIPIAPILSTPANNASGISLTPALSWQSVSGAESYHVQVSTNDTFTNIVFQQSGISGTSVNASGLNFQTAYFWRVSAQNSAGQSPWSQVRTFTTQNQPVVVPAAPTLSAPANNATNISLTPALSWQSVSSAESYQVQVSTNDTFTNIVFQQSGISGTSVNASGLNFQTAYFWRVSAQNSAGQSPWSQVRTFTTQNQPVVVPAAPTLSAPANNATNISLTPALSWQSVSGAQSYQVQVSTNDTFTNIVFQETGISGTSVNASGLNFQTAYFWRVSAQNSAGQSPWSQVRTFTTQNQPVVVPAAPTLSAPANNATNITLTPALSWQSVSGAENYHVQVSTNDTFTNIVFQQSGISGTSVNASGLNFQTAYFWRVSAQNSAGQSPWSQVRTFTTQNQPVVVPAAPTLSAPANNATNITLTPALSWQSVSGAENYHVQVSTNDTFTNIVFQQSGISGTSVNASGLNFQTAYFWRVSAQNSAGQSPWSQVRTFTTQNQPVVVPAAPTLSAPANNATNISLTPALSWQSVSGAESYQVQVSTNDTFTNIVFQETGISGTSVNASGLSFQTAYFWRVSAQNSAGQSPWSQTRTFITIADTSGPTSQLVAHWKMDEGSGNTLIDHSGYGNNGVLRNATNVTWVPGVDGLALNLPGTTNRYAEVNNAPSLNISDAITLSAWIRPTSVQTKSIMGKSVQNGYEINITNAGKIEFWINWTANNLTYHLLSNSNYVANGATWTHVAATFDGLSMKIYLNGVEDNSRTFSSPATILNNNSILRIGAWGTDFRWTGGLDDLRIYHGALNANEIADLYSFTNSNARILFQDREGSVNEETAESLISTRELRTTIFPNPVENHINLMFSSEIEGEVDISIHDVTGRLVFETKTHFEGNKMLIDLIGRDNISAGWYLLTLKTPTNMERFKFLKK
ncbi:LamG-like jellyroll fold domain-containing protein, partial [Lunatibacter salilacus]|uniref:LamG-like jellyroll fold domain-containing protein n=1 Tax=Lunatibacter salilacus TaxID=2483804 RepID=UPI00131DB5D6